MLIETTEPGIERKMQRGTWWWIVEKMKRLLLGKIIDPGGLKNFKIR